MFNTPAKLIGVGSEMGVETVHFFVSTEIDGDQYITIGKISTGRKIGDDKTPPCLLSDEELGCGLNVLNKNFRALGIYGQTCIRNCSRRNGENGGCTAFKEG